MTPVDRFAQAASAYCSWCNGQPDDATEAVTDAVVATQTRAAFVHLAELIRLALDLRQPESADLDRDFRVDHEEWEQVYTHVVTPFGLYGTVLDPLSASGSEFQNALGDLGDDLADIYRDLKEGLLAYEADLPANAEWAWRESFDSHWGQHATEALSALYEWFRQDLDRWGSRGAR